MVLSFKSLINKAKGSVPIQKVYNKPILCVIPVNRFSQFNHFDGINGPTSTSIGNTDGSAAPIIGNKPKSSRGNKYAVIQQEIIRRLSPKAQKQIELSKNLSQTHFDFAQVFLKTGALDSAFRHLSRAADSTKDPTIKEEFMLKLAYLQSENGMDTQALQTFDRVLEFYKKRSLETSLDAVQIYRAKGQIYNRNGKFQQSHENLKKAWSIQIKYHKEFCIEAAEISSEMGEVLESLKHDKAAQEKYLDTIKIYLELPKHDPQLVIDTYLKLIRLNERQDFLNDAITFCTRALELCQNDQKLAFEIYEKKANFLERLKSFQHALDAFKECRKIYTKLTTEPDAKIFELDDKIGDICLSINMIPESIRVNKKKLTLAQQLFGERSFQVISTLDKLGLAYLKEKRFDTSARYYKKARKLIEGIKEEVTFLSDEQVGILFKVCDNLALLKLKTGKPKMNEKYFEDVILPAIEKMESPDPQKSKNIYLSEVFKRFSKICYTRGNIDTTILLNEKSMLYKIKEYPDDIEKVMKEYSAFIDFCISQTKYSQVLPYLHKMADLCAEKNGKEHYETKKFVGLRDHIQKKEDARINILIQKAAKMQKIEIKIPGYNDQHNFRSF